ncbi:MAG TPA: hypothetical protein VEH84_18125 [Alphaproteobacteria bacterium]|nr:hypothetical protein [Alphaproteobacteria bacterium]
MLRPLPKPATPPEASGDPVPTAFDNWLDGQLQSLFGTVADEPVPDDMIDLILKHPREPRH